MRFIVLTTNEQQQLEGLLKSSPNEVIRRRSQCLLLSAKGIPTTQLTTIFDVTLPTLYNWFNAWERRRFEGLIHQPGKGRKAKLEQMSPELLSSLVQAYPRSLDGVLRQLVKQHGISCHRDTLKRQLRRQASALPPNQL